MDLSMMFINSCIQQSIQNKKYFINNLLFINQIIFYQSVSGQL